MEKNKEVLEELYQLLQETEWMQAGCVEDERLVQEIIELMQQCGEAEKEGIRDKMFGLAFYVRKAGFFSGFCYAVRLLMGY